MRTTLVVAGTYAGVALAAPNVAAAEALSAGWPWENPKPWESPKPQANSKPKNAQGSSPGHPGYVNAYNPKPQSTSSRPSGSGGIWSFFKGNGGSSSGSSFGGFGGGSGFGSSKPSGSSDRKGGLGPWGQQAPKPEAAAPKAPGSWGTPAAPVGWGAPAAPAAAEAPAAQEAPAGVEAPDGAEAPAVEGAPEIGGAPEIEGAPEIPAAVEAPIPKLAPKPPKLSPSAPPSTRRQELWQPKVAAPFQIVLSGTVDHSTQVAPDFVEIFDIDLFNTPKASIQALRKQNKKVICYFSAGSSENWRQDFNRFKASDMGKGVAKDDAGKSYWEGEKWLNLRSQNVKNIMKDRIKLGAEKGCHAMDPDNMDGFDNGNGLGLTEKDSINFMQWMAEESAKYNMSIGLKNSMSILPKVQNIIQFAVNEECAAMGECAQYKDFLRTKPVFHIEYTKTKSGGTNIGTDKEYGKGPNSGLGWLFGGRKPSKRAVDASASQACSFKTAPDLGPKFSTVIKVEDLDGWVKFCDGRVSTTRTVGVARSRYSGNAEDASDSQESESSSKPSSFGNLGKATGYGSVVNSGKSAKEEVDDGDD